MKTLRYALACSWILCGAAIADTTIIHAGELLTVPGEQPLREQTIVVTDGRITAVVAGYADPAAYDQAAVVDLKNQFVMPGLMDMHVHLQGELGPSNDRDALKM